MAQRPPRRAHTRTRDLSRAPRDPAPRPTVRRSPRGVALGALLRVEEGAYSHLALPEVLRRTDFSARDRAFVTELVYGTLREQRSLDRALRRHCRRPLDELDPDVRAALRLGAYQLVHGVSPHAAVGETVSLVGEKVRGVVNAVLRSFQDGGIPDPTEARYVRGSYPRWIVEDLDAAYGETDATAALSAMNTPPFVTLRVNPMRATTGSIAAELAAAGATVTPGELLPDALIVRGTGDLASSPVITSGRASVQDQASQAVAQLVTVAAGHRVLDVAAAPGGKAAAIAEASGGAALVVAGDLHDGRVRTMQRGAERLGLRLHGFVADGRHLPFAAASFDRVLLDAPCSGLGVLRRRPDARLRVTRELVAEVAELQRALLVEAARVVAVGGRLVYSVCTLTRTETVGVDAFAASELPGFEARAELAAPWRAAGRGAVLLPHAAGTDGMFVLVLERTA